MGIKQTAELDIENRLIEQLTSGISQWTYRDDLRTEEELWKNLKTNLEENNQSVLNSVLLTEKEFRQVKNQLDFTSYFEASKWLAGENGIAKVSIQREDAKLGKIMLSVFWREEVAGGHSSYEVVNQVIRDRAYPEDQDRRLDVSLLINGLPLIHIELKNQNHPYMDAFRQIKKYMKEGKFTGIFSCLQMFVVSNNVETRYIATASEDKLNEKFLSTWVDKVNHPVDSLTDFAECTLSIPAAHKMVSQYTVIDNEKKSLILLRPYQIHAIEAVKAASKRRESGYIWHTTGSGKTLTSYKVAKNLLLIPSIEKTIFVIDRVDLDTQTSSAFKSYAENDVIDVDNTDNVTNLVSKLANNDRNVVVTTIQKLNHLMKRATNHPDSKKYQSIRALNLAFVVDECHRAVSFPKQQEIKKFFPRSLWYGFTGTPIFEENKKILSGGFQVTTEMQYGARLHEYTVKEAIHDNAVLGFKIKYNEALEADSVKNLAFEIIKGDKNKQSDEGIREEVAYLTDSELEAYIRSEDYNSSAHMTNVVDFIINKSSGLFGFSKGQGNTYTAILTTSSIDKAQRYYELFKSIKSGDSEIKISDKTKRYLPDFPKVAITYSITENENESIINQEKMKCSLKDYNKYFETNYTISELASYNADVNDRLARKKAKFTVRSEQLDLIIVVDRLLTGFDAPCLSTIFIDRKPMPPQDLIQAFSRTNRIFDITKKFGNIVTFQNPIAFKKAVDEALILYSNGGESYVLAPKWEEVKVQISESIMNLQALQPSIIEINTATAEKEELEKVAKAYQSFDKALSLASVYTEYDIKMLSDDYGLTEQDIENLTGKYQNIIESLRDKRDNDDETMLYVDIEYALQQVSGETINHLYILNLIQIFIPSKNDDKALTDKDKSEVIKYIDKLTIQNPKLGQLMQKLWKDILANPKEYQDKHVSRLLDKMIADAERKRLTDFVNTWQVSFDALNFLVKNWRQNLYPEKKQNGQEAMLLSADYLTYKTENENPVSKLKYKRELTDAVYKMMFEEILPLRQV